MKKRQFKRKKPKRSPKPVFLIVTEGKTEEIYFKALRSNYSINKEQIKIEQSDYGTDPLSVVKYAKDRRDEIECDGNVYDEVWGIYDKDNHVTLNKANREASKENINVAFSNPCFELWLLLHYKNQSAYISAKNAENELKKNYSQYHKTKAINDLFNQILGKMKIAINTAEDLRKMHRRNLDQETKNPSTTVDLLVKELIKIGKARNR